MQVAGVEEALEHRDVAALGALAPLAVFHAEQRGEAWGRRPGSVQRQPTREATTVNDGGSPALMWPTATHRSLFKLSLGIKLRNGVVRQLLPLFSELVGLQLRFPELLFQLLRMLALNDGGNTQISIGDSSSSSSDHFQ